MGRGLLCALAAVSLLGGCTFATYARVTIDTTGLSSAQVLERLDAAASRSRLAGRDAGRMAGNEGDYVRFFSRDSQPNRAVAFMVFLRGGPSVEGVFSQLNVYELDPAAVAIYRALVEELRAGFGAAMVNADRQSSRGQQLL